ncbi:hypothetical protein FXO37_35399 [Capsicum annuum]|nr:hypothetical protein FXO37_35399 [Capsicum annuum]
MEYLSRVLKCMSLLPDFKYHPMCKALQLTHFIFADDFMVFGKGEQGSVSRVIEALNHFSAATYLIANMQKSNLFVAGVTDPMKAILDKTVFSLGVFPIRYTNWRIQIAAYVTAWLWRSVPICLWIVWSNLLRAELIRWTNVQLQAGEMKQVLENIKRKHWKTFQKEMIAAIWDAMIYHIRRARNWGLFKGITLQAIDVDVAFKTGDYKQQVIFIGGLTDGFLATDYLEPLAIALDKEKWSLVQFLLSSSYSGYGTSSLRQVLGLAHTQKSSSWGEDCPSPYKETDYPFLFQCGTLSNPYFPTLLVLLLSSGGFTRGSQKLDATELDQLISYLINKEDSEGVVLLGHSTGCQDIVYYMRTNAACSRAVRAAILQAPVSDREYKATLPDTASMIDLASNMISEGRESELMPREANPDAPITAFSFGIRIIKGERHDWNIKAETHGWIEESSRMLLKNKIAKWISKADTLQMLETTWNESNTLLKHARKLIVGGDGGWSLEADLAWGGVGFCTTPPERRGILTGQPYHSLCAYNGEDDLFSSDFSDDQLKQKLGHMSNTPCQVIFSMGDEYIPDYVDKKALVDRQAQKLC